MPSYIVKLSDGGESWYLVWSTIVDAPVTYGMSLDELREHVREEHGAEGLRSLPERLERVERTGTSARDGSTPESMTRHNRAGPGESCLTMAEIIQRYCRSDIGSGEASESVVGGDA